MTQAAVRGSGKLGSLRGQLVRWLLIPLTLLVAVDAVSVYYNALEVADLAYDRSLLASTRALAERVSVVDGHVIADVPYVALDSFETDTLGRIYYKVTGPNGELVSGYGDLPPVPPDVKRSEAYPALVRFYQADYHHQPIRIAALLQPVYDDSMRGIALIQVGETMDARNGMTRKILFDTLWRQGTLVSVAALLVWFAVRFVLRPVMQLREQVESRAPTDLSGFDPALVHKEMRPLVLAMNGYMERLQALISGQRRFIADASHQLRTPLTVLKTQAELSLRELRREPHDAAQMTDLVEGMARTTDATVHLANRLLTLARAEHGAAEGGTAPVSLTEAVRQVALELSQQAVARNIELAFEGETQIRINGNALLLHELMINLLDNAIRYTPAGGRITLRVLTASEPGQATGALLEVEDSGPGIAQADRERVFEPFYRAGATQHINPSGTGLGLSIVREIAALHHASIALDQPRHGGGLVVRVAFPGVIEVLL
ncbi:sensor histidine kinase N-terminal domain-containing protein [Herbaspirillum sp. LeCh32-8]|uniref:sensor histidine kinase n=1 Tax=Herbaspirillum sp. LeCh32-8 TaxID=2821356 RepID=UPI001AE93CC2|nr:sensor histidine kinase [Herbaspirillum sp. LeCh32-8]MBP0598086.1 sensor histidine kinase N-terminal domain-containing protein [Herbaspirillum sp. LeCh32-8]